MVKVKEKMKFKEAAAAVLAESEKAMRVEQIIEIAINEGFVITAAANPAATMSATLNVDIAKYKKKSMFYKPKPAYFDLNERAPLRKPVIYIMTNIAMPDFIKVGKTTRGGLIERLRTMDNTNSPLPFELFYAAEVTNPDRIEKHVARAFIDRKARKNREFYRIAPERIQAMIELAAVEEIRLDTTEQGLTKDDIKALEKERNNRKEQDGEKA